MSMTDEQIKQNAEAYADEKFPSGDKLEMLRVKISYLAGAHSRDEEIEKLKERIQILEERACDVCINKMRHDKELDQLRNPWISVDRVMTEKDYPKIRNNPNDIWERSEDLLVITKEGKLEIAYFEIHRNNNPISSHGDYLLWYKRDKEYDSKVELYGDREVIKWMPINCEI